MCKKCGEEISLISFKWDNKGHIIYNYRCKECGERHEFINIIDDKQLSKLIGDDDLYKKI